MNKAFILLLLCFSLCPHSAFSQEKKNPTYISLSHENDNLGGNSDRYYTSGARATWFNAGTKMPQAIETMASHIPTFDINETTSTYYTIGQNLYTPANIRQENQDPNDRPWAGLLYGSIGLATMTQNESIPAHVDELEFTLGIIGPEALGEQTQKFVHEYISHSPEPMGWDNQLNFEPVFSVSWERRIPEALSFNTDGFNLRLQPGMNVTLGTLRTNIGASAMLIASSNRNMDTPSRVRPAMPGTGVFLTEENELNWQLFAGIEGRAVARDVFLDGNTYRDSYSIDKKPLVGDASAGVSLIYDDYRLSYTLNARSKEFFGQNEESVYGSVTLSKRF